MTQFTDPVRWTASPGDTPDVLRDAFEAGSREGPSSNQMRSLSLKLAAVAAAGAGAAAAGGAVAKPLASTLGGGTAKGLLAGAKMFAAMTVAGAVTVGSAVVYRNATSETTFKSGSAVSGQAVSGQAASGQNTAAQDAPAVAPSERTLAPVVIPERVPSVAPIAQDPSPEQALAPAASEGNVLPQRVLPPVVLDGAPGAREHVAARPPKSGREAERPAQSASAPPAPASAPKSSGTPAVENVDTPVTELGLLRQAQAALEARPREAFALTQKHRAAFPRGQFAEERDALAIQALVRAGERATALDLAERFVAAHPNSAHAHKVRELLNSK